MIFRYELPQTRCFLCTFPPNTLNALPHFVHLTLHEIRRRHRLAGDVILDLVILKPDGATLVGSFATADLVASHEVLRVACQLTGEPVKLTIDLSHGIVIAVLTGAGLGGSYGACGQMGQSGRALHLVAVLATGTRAGVPLNREIVFGSLIVDGLDNALIQYGDGDRRGMHPTSVFRWWCALEP